jgi:hypothetical protein
MPVNPRLVIPEDGFTNSADLIFLQGRFATGIINYQKEDLNNGLGVI